MIIRYKAVSPAKPSKLNLVLTSQVHGKKDDSGILNVFKNEEQHFIYCFFLFVFWINIYTYNSEFLVISKVNMYLFVYLFVRVVACSSLCIPYHRSSVTLVITIVKILSDRSVVCRVS